MNTFGIYIMKIENIFNIVSLKQDWSLSNQTDTNLLR